jgi:fluoroacetyl-CoA thioesterase
MSIAVGARAEVRHIVGEGDTASALGSGDVPVLATPRILTWCEMAAIEAVRPLVPPGHTTVGMRVRLDHLQPTAVGVEVVIEAVLEKVEGRRLTFHVAVNDRRGLVAAGRVTRVLVDTDRFMEKAHH